jgi:glyoxylase-like metal-dependent hydrolase (beta-lactamase superfamily II)
MAEELPFRKEIEFAYGEAKELAPGIVRIVANNPSPFTYKGTNTYIVGQGRDVFLIDPGPADSAHLDAILAALAGRKLTHIVITHTHHDHVDGLPALQERTGALTAGFGRTVVRPGKTRSSPAGGEYVENDFKPDVVLKDGDRLEGSGFALQALHTPGHAPDHLCFALEGTKLFFSGDHVMGWNTSVVAPPEGSMSAYLGAMERLLKREDEIYFPGHGGRVYEPQRLVKAYILHRRMREQSILDCVRNGQTTIAEIVAAIYRGIDPRLVKAASLSVAAHIEHLVERGQLICEGPVLDPVRLSVP